MQNINPNILDIQNLSVELVDGDDRKSILNDITFAIERGEVFGLIGPSGSGKSLTAKTIVSLLPQSMHVSSGKVLYNPIEEDSIDITRCHLDDLDLFRRKHIAMIFQNPAISLNPTLKINKQLKIIQQLANTNSMPVPPFEELLVKMGLSHPERILNAYPHQLSGGQLQRVIIGMTILKKPSLWVADEPTTALDPEIRRQIVDLIISVRKDIGASMLYISHDLETVSRIADRIGLIKDGELQQIGSSKELISKEKRQEPKFKEHQITFTSERQTILELNEVSKSFFQQSLFGFRPKQEIAALDRISFTLHKGDVLGVIGPSGSGKSTLARLLVGLEFSDGGKIIYNGEDLSLFNRRGWRQIRREIQLIHQNPAQSLSPHMTVNAHLIEACGLSNENSDTSADEIVNNIMDEFDLSAELKNRYVFQLSGGECQRVCIARSLILKPNILICDEITSALDESTQEQIISHILKAQSKHQFSIIWITHDLEVIRRVADSIILLDNGKIAEINTTKDFLSAPSSEKGRIFIEGYATPA